ncbi:MAG: hypothetical protein HUK15_01205, partial [Bacteroidales bacterium]|nr:hypothetical protein [Bacteroidales bacterium]
LKFYEAALFQEYTANSGIPAVMETVDADNHVLTFPAWETGRVHHIAVVVAAQLSGSSGDVIRGQLDFENSKFITGNEKIKDALGDVNKEYHLVAADGAMLSVTASGTAYIDRSGRVETIRRGEPLIYEKTIEKMTAMNQCAEVTREELDAFREMAMPERRDMVARKERENGRPEVSIEQIAGVRKSHDAASLIEKKFAVYNPENEKMILDFFNNENRMASFMEDTRINEEYVHDRQENGKTFDADYLNQAAAMYNGFRDAPGRDSLCRRNLEEAIMGRDEQMAGYEAFLSRGGEDRADLSGYFRDENVELEIEKELNEAGEL